AYWDFRLLGGGVRGGRSLSRSAMVASWPQPLNRITRLARTISGLGVTAPAGRLLKTRPRPVPAAGRGVPIGLGHPRPRARNILAPDGCRNAIGAGRKLPLQTTMGPCPDRAYRGVVIRRTAAMEPGAETAGSICLDACELHHLAPLLGFLGDEFTEVGGREREHVATQVGKPRLDLGVGEAGIDLTV